MNRRILLLVVLLPAVAAAVYYFLSPTSPPTVTGGIADSQQARASPGKSQREGGDGKNSTVGNSTGSREKKPAMNWKRFTSEPRKPATAADIDRFLAKRGETPANLVTAFEHSHDRGLLERALELFPNSPVVLMAAMDSIPTGPSPKPGETYRPDAQRVAFIGRFKAADPDNPLPRIFSAQELFKAGQTAEAVAEIRAALDLPAFYTYANERLDSEQQFSEDLGDDPLAASLMVSVMQKTPQMGAAFQSSRGLMDWQKAATESGDAAAAADAIRLTYSLGRTFATPEASRTIMGQTIGITIEKLALKALPADAQPAWLAITPAQRLAELKKQGQDMSDLTEAADLVRLVQTQDEQLLAEYLRRNRSDGEFSALTWLRAQKK